MKESKTVQCYPSDSAINEMIAVYNDFGWELTGNQRCREDDGTYGDTQYYKTFNKLTFAREKSEPWYEKVSELENKYHTWEYLYNNTEQPEGFNKRNLSLIILGPIGWIILIAYAASTKKKLKKWENDSKKKHYEYYQSMQDLRKEARAYVNA